MKLELSPFKKGLVLPDTYMHTQLVITTLQSRLLPSFSHQFIFCVLILYMSGGSQFRTTDFLKNFICLLYYTPLSFCQQSAEKPSPKKYLFIFRFVQDI